MISRFKNHQLVSGMMVEEPENPPENSGGDSSSRSAVSGDAKMASTPSSSRTSRRATQKRVMSVPIKDVEGLRMKSDHMSAPPSDSWAWRKYGQKPIKGSPYPRGYYRCSSSKGCPARKQVERSKLDPSMLVVTYSCEHNHPWLASRNNILHNNHHTTTSSAGPASITTTITTTNATASASEEDETEEEEEKEEKKPVNLSNQSHQEPIPDQKFTSPGDGVALIHGDEIGWLGDFESTTCTTLESPILTEDKIIADDEMALVFTIQEEDESLFADLGELPECSTVFRREMAQIEAEQRPPSLATTT